MADNPKEAGATAKPAAAPATGTNASPAKAPTTLGAAQAAPAAPVKQATAPAAPEKAAIAEKAKTSEKAGAAPISSAQSTAAQSKPAPAAPRTTGVKAGSAKTRVKPARATALGASSRKTGQSKISRSKAAVNTTAAGKARAIAKPASNRISAVKAQTETAAKAAPTKPAVTRPETKTVPETQPSIIELKEKIMATKNTTTDYTDTVSAAVADIQDRQKAAYEKGNEMLAEMTDFAKGTTEAVVESSKIVASAMQDLGRSYAEEARNAYEQATADLKEIAAVKSPTELFQLQGKILRRNFDAVVATTSKNAETVMKVSNDAFAPISARLNVAAEKFSKA